jgi:hypothetical protein
MKKGGDAGYIPNECPQGYFRSMALCYVNCKSNYQFFGGVCWEVCPSRFDEHPASCYKNLFNWFFKDSYIPSSKTNFSSEIPCDKPTDYKAKGGALCYRDCEKIGMQNCGIGACAADNASCTAGIVSMVSGVLTGIAKAVSFVASLGATSALPDVWGEINKAWSSYGKQILAGVLLVKKIHDNLTL